MCLRSAIESASNDHATVVQNMLDNKARKRNGLGVARSLTKEVSTRLSGFREEPAPYHWFGTPRRKGIPRFSPTLLGIAVYFRS